VRTDLFSIEREICPQDQIVRSQIVEISHYKWAIDRIIDRVRADYRIGWEESGLQQLMPGAGWVELDTLTEQLDRAQTAPEGGYGR
jgi:hypothetical protein